MESVLAESALFSANPEYPSRLAHGNNINSKNCRYYFYMQDRPVAENRVIIPNAFHQYLINPRSERERGETEEAKTLPVVRYYLAPNRDSKPLGLTACKEVREDRSESANVPLFDKFDLSAIFSQRAMTPEEFSMWHPEDSIDQQRFETPVRDRAACPSTGGFKRCDLMNTEATSKTYKSAIEGKKSRPKQKGLRKLSQRAYEIVLNMRSASYKEVANKLVDELNNEKELDQEGKDEQNIKRRVYDALNVLIALGVLRKEGRKIVGDRDLDMQFGEIEKEKLAVELRNKKKAMRKKQRELESLMKKQRVYRRLLQSNKQKESMDSVVQLPFIFIQNAQPGTLKIGTPATDHMEVKMVVAKDKNVFDPDMSILHEYYSLKDAEMAGV